MKSSSTKKAIQAQYLETKKLGGVSEGSRVLKNIYVLCRPEEGGGRNFLRGPISFSGPVKSCGRDMTSAEGYLDRKTKRKKKTKKK